MLLGSRTLLQPVIEQLLLMGAQGLYHTIVEGTKGKQKAQHTAEHPEADLLQEGKAAIGYRLPHRHLSRSG